MPGQVEDQVGHTLTLGDGRRLGYADLGDGEGPPLFLFHGTPSSRLEAVWLDEAAGRTGWRLIAADRPGHGLSSPAPRSVIVDTAADVAALADHLGVDRFAVLGYSGGAPFALATALTLGHRVSVTGIVSGWGPPDRPGAYDGVAPSERLSDAVARHTPILTRVMFTGINWFVRLAPTTSAQLLTRRLSADDAAGPATPDALAAVRESFRQGAAGPAHDLHLIVSPWGFVPDALDGPVCLWHGDRDPEIPLQHAEHLVTTVADGRLEVIEGGDHFMLYAHADDIFTALAGASGQFDDLGERVVQAVGEEVRLGDGAGVGVDTDVEVVHVRKQGDVGR